MVRLAILLLFAGCKSPDPPSSFGVNLTIKAGELSSEVRSRLRTVNLFVDGESTPYHRAIDVASVIRSSDVRVHYVPGVRSGTLTFTANAIDLDMQLVAATESSVSAAIIDGHATSATLVLLAAAPLDMTVDTDANADIAAVHKMQGQACGAGDICDTSGGCRDGYCCDTACANACSACNVSGREGVCSPVAAGAAPAHGSCGPDPASGCQRDGKCDGAGACHLYPLGTVCLDSTCASGTFTPASTCDGNGVCKSAPSMPCDPYVCKDAKVCFDSCADSTACKAPNTCDAMNSCGTKPNGGSCSVGTQCTSTFCVDGVCCENACTGKCKTCSLVTPGTCSNVPDGQDPDGDCPAGAGSNAVCSPGMCNGSGSCRVANAGTPCAAGCVSNAPSNTVCDAAGACTQTVTGTTCNASCQSCTVNGVNASCVNLPNSTPCANGFCSGSVMYGKVYCNNGSCPSQGSTGNCGNYSCFVDGNGDTQCYANCGCCAIICLCMSYPSHCAPGITCQSDYTCHN
jgi:hypothetical protein